MSFRVAQIDHVELTVPSRFEAADWYKQILGLEIMPELQFFADDPRGPLMIGTVDAGTKLALFEGAPRGPKRKAGFHRVAFRVSGREFLEFLDQLKTIQLLDSRNNVVTPDDVVDHQAAFSLYFCDPWGHQLEITTYDHEVVRQRPGS